LTTRAVAWRDVVVRVLVTGGTGTLGRVVVRSLAAAGDEVHALWHRQPPAPQPAVEWHQQDLTDFEATRRLIDRLHPEVVIHTAYARPDEPEVVTTTASAVIAEAGATVGARLLHLSTDVVFDGTRGGYTEDDPIHPVSAYGRAKAEAERLVRDAHPAALIVRTSLIYRGAEPGPQERLVADALDAALDHKRGLAFFTDEVRSVVQVDDLAAAVVELIPHTSTGIIHVAGPEPISRYDFACGLAVAAGRDPSRLRPASSAGLEPPRPQNCTLDSSRAAALLTTRLRGVTEVLALPPPPVADPERQTRT
jgi:dTDP-4-dehydrorhamnose reductase